jgi:tetratricopeptide (TPR) repeat protein
MFYRRRQRFPDLFEDTPEGQKENFSLDNLLVEDTTPEDLILQEDMALQLNKSLEKLPQRFREVILLYYFSGLSYKEVSGILDIPITDVTNKLHQAKKIMKKEFVDLMENERDFEFQSKGMDWVKDVAALIEEGYAVARLRNVEGALKIFERASRLAGESPDAHLYVAESIISLYWLSERNKAVADRALQENKIALSLGLEGAVHENGSPVDLWEAYSNMALIYLQLDEFEKAKFMFDKAKEAGQPYDLNEGSLYSSQGGKYEKKQIDLYKDRSPAPALKKEHSIGALLFRSLSILLLHLKMLRRHRGRCQDRMDDHSSFIQYLCYRCLNLAPLPSACPLFCHRPLLLWQYDVDKPPCVE